MPLCCFTASERNYSGTSYELTDRPFPVRKAIFFYLGMIVLTVMFMSPLHTLGKFFLLSAYMLTMMLVLFVVAPLVLLWLPGWLVAPRYLHRREAAQNSVHGSLSQRHI